MLYHSWIKKYEKEIDDGVKSLFEKAFKNQNDTNDLLLVLINGFYGKNKEGNNTEWSPYKFGAGNEGYAESAQYDFFDHYRKNVLTEETREEFTNRMRLENQIGYQLDIQLGLLVYLKFWESDSILKQFYNLSNNLIHGKPYDWEKEMKSSGRKHLIEDQIIKSTTTKCPKFHTAISSTYDRQIRNAIAHSQYFILGDYITLNNYNPEDNHCRQSIKIAEWEILFHKTILFYNSLIRYRKKYEGLYKSEAEGKPLKIFKDNRLIKEQCIRFDNDRQQWVWYSV